MLGLCFLVLDVRPYDGLILQQLFLHLLGTDGGREDWGCIEGNLTKERFNVVNCLWFWGRWEVIIKFYFTLHFVVKHNVPDQTYPGALSWSLVARLLIVRPTHCSDKNRFRISEVSSSL